MKNIITSLIISCSLTITAAQPAETRQASAELEVGPSDRIEVLGKHTPLRFESWDKNKIEVEATLVFTGKVTNKMQKFLDDFEDQIKNTITRSGSRITIETRVDEPNKVQVGGKAIGVVIGYGDKELRVDYVIRVPRENSLTIQAAYKEVHMTGSYDEVSINHYSGDLFVDEVKNLILEAKYGEAVIDLAQNINLKGYQLDLEGENIETIDGSSRYGNVQIKEAGSINLQGYETDILVGEAGYLAGTFRYGNIHIDGKLEKSRLDLYEVDVTGTSFEQLVIVKDKYSRLTFDRGHRLIFEESYQSKATIRYLNHLESVSKYGKYQIEQLGQSFNLEGYNDKMTLGLYPGKTHQVSIDGRYLKVDLDANQIPIDVTAKFRYGKLNYDKSRYQTVQYIKESDRYDIHVKTKNESPTSAVSVGGYQVEFSF